MDDRIAALGTGILTGITGQECYAMDTHRISIIVPDAFPCPCPALQSLRLCGACIDGNGGLVVALVALDPMGGLRLLDGLGRIMLWRT